MDVQEGTCDKRQQERTDSRFKLTHCPVERRGGGGDQSAPPRLWIPAISESATS